MKSKYENIIGSDKENKKKIIADIESQIVT